VAIAVQGCNCRSHQVLSLIKQYKPCIWPENPGQPSAMGLAFAFTY
jgi:hypothetical protein